MCVCVRVCVCVVNDKILQDCTYYKIAQINQINGQLPSMIFHNHGVDSVIHYLDDYLFVAPLIRGTWEGTTTSHSRVSATGSETVTEEAGRLNRQFGLPGAATGHNQIRGQVTRGQDTRLKQLLLEWRQKCTCTKRELLSLLKVLHYACQVVRPGRTFLRRIIELSKMVKLPHHHIWLNADFRSDLEFLPRWNGVGLLQSLYSRPTTRLVASDASGSWGCGTFSSGWWFQFPWPAE